jgi:hypothetical protein
MIEFRIGDQLIRFDREATIIAYSEMRQGGADCCTCAGCRNFVLLRDKAYPDTFRSLLNQLGIDARKEGEAVHYGPEGDLHLYGGWFYFVGEVVELGERLTAAEGAIQYWFSNSFPQPPESFRGPVAALEFSTELPWVLEVSEDPPADAQMKVAEDVMKRYENTLRALAKPTI